MESAGSKQQPDMPDDPKRETCRRVEKKDAAVQANCKFIKVSDYDEYKERTGITGPVLVHGDRIHKRSAMRTFSQMKDLMSGTDESVSEKSDNAPISSLGRDDTDMAKMKSNIHSQPSTSTLHPVTQLLSEARKLGILNPKQIVPSKSSQGRVNSLAKKHMNHNVSVNTGYSLSGFVANALRQCELVLKSCGDQSAMNLALPESVGVDVECIDADGVHDDGTDVESASTNQDNGSTDVERASTNQDNGGTDVDSASTNQDNGSTDVERASTNQDNGSTDVESASTNQDNGSTDVDSASTNQDNGSTDVESASTNQDNGSTDVESASTNQDDVNIDEKQVDLLTWRRRSSRERTKCSHCDKMFTDETQRKQHEADHVALPVRCGACEREFSDDEKLIQHVKAMHFNSPIKSSEGIISTHKKHITGFKASTPLSISSPSREQIFQKEQVKEMSPPSLNSLLNRSPCSDNLEQYPVLRKRQRRTGFVVQTCESDERCGTVGDPALSDKSDSKHSHFAPDGKTMFSSKPATTGVMKNSPPKLENNTLAHSITISNTNDSLVKRKSPEPAAVTREPTLKLHAPKVLLVKPLAKQSTSTSSTGGQQGNNAGPNKSKTKKSRGEQCSMCDWVFFDEKKLEEHTEKVHKKETNKKMGDENKKQRESSSEKNANAITKQTDKNDSYRVRPAQKTLIKNDENRKGLRQRRPIVYSDSIGSKSDSESNSSTISGDLSLSQASPAKSGRKRQSRPIVYSDSIGGKSDSESNTNSSTISGALSPSQASPAKSGRKRQSRPIVYSDSIGTGSKSDSESNSSTISGDLSQASPAKCGRKQCPHCSQSFASEEQFDWHLASHLSGFTCNICHRVIGTERGLKIHFSRLHGTDGVNDNKKEKEEESVSDD